MKGETVIDQPELGESENMDFESEITDSEELFLQEIKAEPVVDEPELGESENMDNESENTENYNSEENDSNGGIYQVAWNLMFIRSLFLYAIYHITVNIRFSV